MKVIHLSAECYPVAKVGGLGDVVGALPKYLCQAGVDASVVMPFYDRKFTQENSFKVVHQAPLLLGNRPISYDILKESTNKLGFELYLIRIPGLLDRVEVYGHSDETEQFVAFQIAFLDWLISSGIKPDILHCHDHHTGLVPFLVSHSARYKELAMIPTICTIHNGQYQGSFEWDKLVYLPEVDLTKGGLLDWGGRINPLASSVKCCWKFTTVSQSYLKELSLYSNGLEYLFAAERDKGVGIINGIDTDVWNPQTDTMIVKQYAARTVGKGKETNKAALCAEFGLNADKPLVSFIGRLVGEKGADLLYDIIVRSLDKHKGELNFMVLGSGEPEIERALASIRDNYSGSYNVMIGYNEALSHRIYAASDFLIMPSRVEPCGLNQLYSMRYGTLPVVRSTGGLKDTVIDFESEGGYGVSFDDAGVESACTAVDRSVALFANTAKINTLRKKIMALDFSWDQSANQYIDLYTSLIS
ncbi:MAG: starch synthase [Sphingobacteriaceae bacterium]|jgi:starch synthase|nr:starch synthase [Sphingobacteriaceae bacterium]